MQFLSSLQFVALIRVWRVLLSCYFVCSFSALQCIYCRVALHWAGFLGLQFFSVSQRFKIRFFGQSSITTAQDLKLNNHRLHSDRKVLLLSTSLEPKQRCHCGETDINMSQMSKRCFLIDFEKDWLYIEIVRVLKKIRTLFRYIVIHLRITGIVNAVLPVVRSEIVVVYILRC